MKGIFLRSVTAPYISLNDLTIFHNAHFRVPSSGTTVTASTPYRGVFEQVYADGVPRRITDEQVAIFRHSEIQRELLRRRKLRQTGSPNSTGTGEQTLKCLLKRKRAAHTPTATPSRKSYAHHCDPHDSQGRTFRRIAREMDEVKSDTIQLEY